MSFNSVIVDYAQPLIRLEKLSREIHDLCLDNKYLAASDKTVEMLAELRILKVSLAIMAEKEGERDQT